MNLPIKKNRSSIRMFCERCGYKVSIDDFQKLNGKRLDICTKCFSEQQDKQMENEMAKKKADKQIEVTETPKVKVVRNCIPGKLSANIEAIVEKLKEEHDITRYILAASIAKRDIIQLLLGKTDKGWVKILNTMYFGGEYTVKTGIKRTGIDTLSYDKVALPSLKTEIDAIYEAIPNKKAHNIEDEKLQECFAIGMTVEQVCRFFPRYKKEKVELFFAQNTIEAETSED